MQRLNFITGVALLIVAVTVAVTVTLRPVDPQPLARSAAPDQPAAADKSAGADKSVGIGERPSLPLPGGAPRTVPAERFTVEAPAGHPAWASLSEQAERVEAHANQRLDHLTEHLELTGAQRRKLFPILARGAESYDPAMVIGGVLAGASALAGVAGEQAVDAALTPGQKDQLVEDAMTDMVLWQEIIAGLQRRLAEQTPQVGVAAAPAAPAAPEEAAEPPAPAPRRNLFETGEPAR